MDGMAGPLRWLEVAPTGADVTLALTAAQGSPAGQETGIRFTAPDAAAAHAALTDHGVRAGELLRWPGVPPMSTFDDPDGRGPVRRRRATVRSPR